VITAIFDDDGDLRGFAKVTRDLTERKAIEEARASFISNAAHELRTPLSVLVGLITFLQGAREAPTPEQLEEHLDTLGRAADRMRSLVNNLLDLTKLEQASVPVILERVSLSELVERALIAVPPPSNKRVESNVGDTYVLAEPGRLTQVLTNLLLNAYRYGGSNIGLRTRQNRSMVEVIVEDDGPGVEPSLRDHVFEPFRRGNTNNASEGSGLGMTIVKRFVESFGGTVSLDTTASGARFVVKLRKG
jgi:signal transduction histidine kinase